MRYFIIVKDGINVGFVVSAGTINYPGSKEVTRDEYVKLSGLSVSDQVNSTDLRIAELEATVDTLIEQLNSNAGDLVATPITYGLRQEREQEEVPE